MVEVPPNDPQWVAYRSLAYQRALLDAQAKYAQRQIEHISEQTATESEKPADAEPPPYVSSDSDPTKAAELVRKLEALGTGQLDKQLRDLGINPADYERDPEPQRYVRLRKALTYKGMVQAVGDLAGLIPVQTFEKYNGKGTYIIGVVAVVSPRMKDFAKQVLTERGQFPPDAAHASKLADLVANKSKLIRDFGVRWLYDESGLPVLVSFAQWASDYCGPDPIIAERHREMALEQAELLADGQIADFLKGSVNVTRNDELGYQIAEAADRMPNGYVAPQDMSNCSTPCNPPFGGSQTFPSPGLPRWPVGQRTTPRQGRQSSASFAFGRLPASRRYVRCAIAGRKPQRPIRLRRRRPGPSKRGAR